MPGLVVWAAPCLLRAATGAPRVAGPAQPSKPAMSAAAALPFDPTVGELSDKIPAELDSSKMKPLSAVPDGIKFSKVP